MWTLVEIGDGTTPEYGISVSDLTADVLGAAAGYLHETSPWVHRVFDLRTEYWPSDRAISESDDPLSDYWGLTWLVAVNVGGLTSRRPGLADLLDVQFGYRTRGYDDPDADPQRWVFVGVGLNLANLLRRWRSPARCSSTTSRCPGSRSASATS